MCVLNKNKTGAQCNTDCIKVLKKLTITDKRSLVYKCTCTVFRLFLRQNYICIITCELNVL